MSHGGFASHVDFSLVIQSEPRNTCQSRGHLSPLKAKYRKPAD